MKVSVQVQEKQQEYDQRREVRLINEMMELLVTHHGGEMTEEELDSAIDDLQKAIDISRNSHSGQRRKSGEPYFFHPLRVAHMAARYWMDFPSVIAAILHDVVEDTDLSLEHIIANFGSEVALLVNGLTKVEDDRLSREALQAETYRKQLLAAIEDIRVLCLKFWDRIDNMRTIAALSPAKQQRIAEETRKVYVPLARHLGMGMVAAELESLALTTIYPGRASRYRRALEAVQDEAAPKLRRIRAVLAGSFEHHKLSAKMKDRWRTFSVAAARDAGRGLASLYTLDIQVDRAMDAYLALGILHSLFAPIPGKLRDHLYTMSRHGYQALKTTVQAGEYRLRVEITTRKFARFNEAGVLAPGFDFSRKNFQKLMTSLMEGESAVDTESLRLASSQIRVFTPRGEPRILPEGSGVLDFAFDIHEELGLHALRARINGKTRLLKARLMDGDQVEIERGENPQVLPKWLEWAITPRARNAIRKYLRTQVQKSKS